MSGFEKYNRLLPSSVWYSVKNEGNNIKKEWKPDELVDASKANPIDIKSVCVQNNPGAHTESEVNQAIPFALRKHYGFKWPENEFKITQGSKPCKYGKNSAYDGIHPVLQRTDYLGDKTKCCLSDEDIIDGDHTCDPLYRDVTSGECRNTLKYHCEQGSNIFDNNICLKFAEKHETLGDGMIRRYCQDNIGDDERCKIWALGNQEFGTPILKRYCTDDRAEEQVCMDYAEQNASPSERARLIRARCIKNLDDPSCQKWARRSTPTNKVRHIDQAVLEYCKNNDDPAFCSCVNAEVTAKEMQGGMITPYCFSEDCTKNELAYKYGRWQGLNCPEVLRCEQVMDITENTAMNIDFDKVEQGCEISHGYIKNDQSKSKIDKPDQPDKLSKSENDKDVEWGMILVVLLVVVILISFVVLITVSAIYLF